MWQPRDRSTLALSQQAPTPFGPRYCALGPVDAAAANPIRPNRSPLSSHFLPPHSSSSSSCCAAPSSLLALPPPPAPLPRPCAKVAMSHRAESSSASRSGRRQERGCSSTRVHAVAYPTGKESGLPLIECPDCGLARVIELRAKKDTVNNGRTFFKCPRNGVSFSIPLC